MFNVRFFFIFFFSGKGEKEQQRYSVFSYLEYFPINSGIVNNIFLPYSSTYLSYEDAAQIGIQIKRNSGLARSFRGRAYCLTSHRE